MNDTESLKENTRKRQTLYHQASEEEGLFNVGKTDLPAPLLRFGTSRPYVVSASLSGKIKATSLLTVHLTKLYC